MTDFDAEKMVHEIALLAAREVKRGPGLVQEMDRRYAEGFRKAYAMGKHDGTVEERERWRQQLKLDNNDAK